MSLHLPELDEPEDRPSAVHPDPVTVKQMVNARKSAPLGVGLHGVAVSHKKGASTTYTDVPGEYQKVLDRDTYDSEYEGGDGVNQTGTGL